MRGTTLARRGATRLGDLPELRPLAERTTLVRVSLALALAATLSGLLLLARTAGSGRAAVLPSGAKTGVVLLDMSASVTGPAFERISTVVRGLVAANQSIGLVMFSDVAYELLPPNSPPNALQPFLRFFAPRSVTGGTPVFGQSPWSHFSGGTKISTGLVAGARALRKAGVTHGSLLLLSDLNDAQEDSESLVAESIALRKAHIPVRIVSLNASPTNVELFGRLFGENSFIPTQAFRTVSRHHVLPILGSSPWALIAVGFVLVGLLAANERYNSRLLPEAAA